MKVDVIRKHVRNMVADLKAATLFGHSPHTACIYICWKCSMATQKVTDRELRYVGKLLTLGSLSDLDITDDEAAEIIRWVRNEV